MTQGVFNPFAAYSDKIDVRFFAKDAALRTDDNLIKLLGTDAFVSLKQVHGNSIAVVDVPSHRTIEADASATDTPDLWLTIRAADCQQLIVYIPKANMIGVIHAGWKGLKAKVISAFFESIKTKWNIDPVDAYVAIGPSLCTNCAEFTDPIVELTGLDARFFHGRNADLRGIADQQLLDLGIQSEHIERNPDCTRCNSDSYWSYRGNDKEQVRDGCGNVLAIKLKIDN